MICQKPPIRDGGMISLTSHLVVFDAQNSMQCNCYA
jgi:hypothetical protein